MVFSLLDRRATGVLSNQCQANVLPQGRLPFHGKSWPGLRKRLGFATCGEGAVAEGEKI